MHINTEMQTVFFEPDADTELVKDAFMPFGELVLVFLLSVTICQLQMLLCLWFKPVYSFMIMCMLMLASAYFQSVFNRKLCNAYKAFMDKCGWNGL